MAPNVMRRDAERISLSMAADSSNGARELQSLLPAGEGARSADEGRSDCTMQRGPSSALRPPGAKGEGHEVRVQSIPWWLRPFLLRGVAAITLGRRIYIASNIPADARERVLRHE